MVETQQGYKYPLPESAPYPACLAQPEAAPVFSRVLPYADMLIPGSRESVKLSEFSRAQRSILGIAIGRLQETTPYVNRAVRSTREVTFRGEISEGAARVAEKLASGRRSTVFDRYDQVIMEVGTVGFLVFLYKQEHREQFPDIQIKDVANLHVKLLRMRGVV